MTITIIERVSAKYGRHYYVQNVSWPKPQAPDEVDMANALVKHIEQHAYKHILIFQDLNMALRKRIAEYNYVLAQRNAHYRIRNLKLHMVFIIEEVGLKDLM